MPMTASRRSPKMATFGTDEAVFEKLLAPSPRVLLRKRVQRRNIFGDFHLRSRLYRVGEQSNPVEPRAHGQETLAGLHAHGDIRQFEPDVIGVGLEGYEQVA